MYDEVFLENGLTQGFQLIYCTAWLAKLYSCSTSVALLPYFTAFPLLMDTNFIEFPEIVEVYIYFICSIVMSLTLQVQKKKKKKLTQHHSFFVLKFFPPAVGAGAAGTDSAAGNAVWPSSRCLSIGWSSSWCSSTPSPYHQNITTSLCGWPKCRVGFEPQHAWQFVHTIFIMHASLLLCILRETHSDTGSIRKRKYSVI